MVFSSITKGQKMAARSVEFKRKWLRDELLRDPRLWTAWSYCLFKAREEDGDEMVMGYTVPVRAGEFATTFSKMAQDLGMRRSTVRSLVNRLKAQGRLDTESTGSYTILRIREAE